MDNDTWIKLYRKIIEHDVFRDESAYRVFTWILCRVNYKTGKMISGRFWASEILDLKPTTYYGIIKRLEKKYNLVTLSSDNKNTTISVKNWHKYQSTTDTSTDNKLTTNRQQTDTRQEVKKKKERERGKLTPTETKALSRKYNVTVNAIKKVHNRYLGWCENNDKNPSNLHFANSILPTEEWSISDLNAKKQGDYLLERVKT